MQVLQSPHGCKLYRGWIKCAVVECDSNLKSIHDNSASKLPDFPLHQVIHVVMNHNMTCMCYRCNKQVWTTRANMNDPVDLADLLTPHLPG